MLQFLFWLSPCYNQPCTTTLTPKAWPIRLTSVAHSHFSNCLDGPPKPAIATVLLVYFLWTATYLSMIWPGHLQADAH